MRIEVPPASGLPGFNLRQLELSDVPDWYAYLSLPAVVEYTSWNLNGPEDLKALCDRFESPSPDSSCRLAVVDRSVNRLIGTIGFHTVSQLNRSAELAFDFAPAYWGRGIATAMCKTVTQWSYRALNLVRVQATVLETNRSSVRVLQKCGFAYEGLLRSYRMVRGRPGNFKMYSRLDAKWLPWRTGVTGRFVRQAVTDDAQAAITLWRLSVAQLCVADHQNDGPTLERWLRNKTVEVFFKMLADSDSYVVVAGEGLSLCGIGQLHRSGELHLCYVRPGRQRSGFGSAILMALEAQARRWGLTEIRLRSTVGSRTFYERQGYVSTGAPIPAYGVLLDYPYAKRIVDGWDSDVCTDPKAGG